ncbi:MAG: lyase family protein, partial [Bacteroidota bacterium]
MPSLLAISPVDGRYAAKTESLQPYFSEFALIRYRVLVEIKYLRALYELGIPQLQHTNPAALARLTEIYEVFNIEDAQRIKDIEKTTNHDVKAVEYFLKEKMQERGLGDILEFVHFGLTSQDINNTAIPL